MNYTNIDIDHERDECFYNMIGVNHVFLWCLLSALGSKGLLGKWDMLCGLTGTFQKGLVCITLSCHCCCGKAHFCIAVLFSCSISCMTVCNHWEGTLTFSHWLVTLLRNYTEGTKTGHSFQVGHNAAGIYLQDVV